MRVVRAAIGGACQFAGQGVGLASGSGADVAILVGCGDRNTLCVREVQPEGKRPDGSAEFLRGAGRKFAASSQWG